MYMYIHVHVVMYLYVHGINMSVPCSDTYVPFCPILSRWVGFQMVMSKMLPEISTSMEPIRFDRIEAKKS